MSKINDPSDRSVCFVGDASRFGMKEGIESARFYSDCKILYDSSRKLVSNLINVLLQAKEYCQVDETFTNNIDSVASFTEGLKKVNAFKTGNNSREMENIRVNLWKARLHIEKLAISKLINDLVVELLDSSLTESALRMAHLYNELLILNLSTDFTTTNVFGNTCPMLLYPLRKLSMTRLLQIIAGKRAERCGYNLISGLLSNYFEAEEEWDDATVVADEDDLLTPRPETVCSGNDLKSGDEKDPQNKKFLVAQNSVSSNTSVEIYRALTKHLENGGKEHDLASNQTLDVLWRNEEKHVRGFLILCSRAAPQLLGSHFITSAKSSGNPRPVSTARHKLTNYYQRILWGEVGAFLEHILMWWSSDPLGSYPPQMCLSLWDYILELKTAGNFIPPLLIPSVNSLLDAMCCHLTSTSWDQLFRKALVSAGTVKKNVYTAYGIEGSATGQLFLEMLTDLIKLNNSCEDISLSLEELPLVEQIPILHRLDHSVHTVRMWMSSRCRNLAGKWDLDGFYCTYHTDISKCLQTLSTLQLMNHNEIPANTSVHVTVCTKMRAKLVSEIRENIDKLKKTAAECLRVLAKDCRRESLAILHMCFPTRSYWRQNGPLPDCASDYVEKYLDSVLRPVFVATQKMTPEIQQSSCAMVLRILCESWLEYVYLHRIKFSEWGAVQLLTDFGAVPTWLMERVQLPKELLNFLVSHEVLRRCEGVGRLLLRRRGESIRMSAPGTCRSSGEDFSADNMPAEMYVPNQEQWLDLRAPVKANICCQL
ncbi:hypothetical protein RUM44_010277 [Polyplax serrata]|uniref:WH2 domain-containing protein n=1 Tax=Polyplax serrata TaxID=468196 RepID=A0ABR1AVD9_POLSC